jgi:hypothetical protein
MESNVVMLIMAGFALGLCLGILWEIWRREHDK